MFRKFQKRGQSSIEYVVLVIVVIGAFLASSFYLKRGIQGRWKEAVDAVGDQYDPLAMSTDINHTILSNSESRIWTELDTGGHYTMRQDSVNSIETKKGASRIAPPY